MQIHDDWWLLDGFEHVTNLLADVNMNIVAVSRKYCSLFLLSFTFFGI